MMTARIKGFTLLATLFILIILAMAGAYLFKIGMMQQQIVNYTLLLSRAQMAARSGLELAQQQHFAQPYECPAQTIHFDEKTRGLTGFDVTISCQEAYSYPTTHPTYSAYLIQAVAKKGSFGDRDYVSQEMQRWNIVQLR
jgi:type II secretory pathway pseudopilin PulG